MKTIVLTGFKPFAKHIVNDSETCVKLIAESGLDQELDVNLITEVFDVSYNSVIQRVPALWTEHDPFLVIHLGAHEEDTIKIERCARKYGYKHPDTVGICPIYQVCPFGEQHLIYSELDVTDILTNGPRGNYMIGSSENAGLFLCEYVYYISLSHDPGKVLFIHVPSYKGPISPLWKALIIKDIIKELYHQRVMESHQKKSALSVLN